jgi:hypothetical protein
MLSPQEDSSDSLGGDSISSDSLGSDGMPGSRGGGSLWPWLAIFRYAGGASPSKQSWPSLPLHSGDERWSQQVAEAPHACPACGLVASQNGKAAAPSIATNGSRLFWAHASRCWGKAAEKAIGRTMSHVHRPLSTTTGEGSSHLPGPEVKFKKHWVCKSMEARTTSPLDIATLEHQWSMAEPPEGPCTAMLAEEDSLQPHGPLPCLSQAGVDDPMLLEDLIIRPGPSADPCTDVCNRT